MPVWAKCQPPCDPSRPMRSAVAISALCQDTMIEHLLLTSIREVRPLFGDRSVRATLESEFS